MQKKKHTCLILLLFSSFLLFVNCEQEVIEKEVIVRDTVLVDKPFIEQIYPFAKYMYSGGLLEIYGNNLSNLEVFLDNRNVEDFQSFVKSNTYIRFKIPSGSSGSSLLSLSNKVFSLSYSLTINASSGPKNIKEVDSLPDISKFEFIDFIEDAWANSVNNENDIQTNSFEILRACFDFEVNNGIIKYSVENHIMEPDIEDDEWDCKDEFDIYVNDERVDFIFWDGFDEVLSGGTYRHKETGEMILFLRSNVTGYPFILNNYKYDKILNKPNCDC